MATTNLDSADLKAVAAGGLINEDVMQKIWEIDNIPLEFSSRCGKSTCDNSYTEWTTEELAAVDLNNAVIDGADTTGNNTKVGARLGNHCQESVKVVRVSERADASNTIGGIGSKGHQMGQRQKELKRDLEGISLTAQASVADDGSAVAGKTAGVFAFLVTNIDAGATGTHTGFNTTTKVIAAGTAGTKRALTEKMLRDVAQKCYNETGRYQRPLILMARPPIIRLIDEYSFTSTARIATQTRQTGDGPGMAVGYIDIFKTDFAPLELTPNILQPTTAAATSTVGIFDFDYVQQCFLKGIHAAPLAKTGLAENSLMSCDWCTKVLNEKAIGAIFDVDEAVAMTA